MNDLTLIIILYISVIFIHVYSLYKHGWLNSICSLMHIVRNSHNNLIIIDLTISMNPAV